MSDVAQMIANLLGSSEIITGRAIFEKGCSRGPLHQNSCRESSTLKTDPPFRCRHPRRQ